MKNTLARAFLVCDGKIKYFLENFFVVVNFDKQMDPGNLVHWFYSSILFTNFCRILR